VPPRLESKAYLGFAVIKPLERLPVGRTVIRHLIRLRARNELFLPCTKSYSVHLARTFDCSRAGVSTADTGVSAAPRLLCGQHSKGFAFSRTSPQQHRHKFTLLSARYTLPFGKAMPSEGLSIDQMCQAVQAIGVAPNLYRLGTPSTSHCLLYGTRVLVLFHQEWSRTISYFDESR